MRELGDEIRVTVIATGIDPTKKERRLRNTQRASQIQSVPQKQNLDIEPARSNDGQSAFGEWDIR